MKLQLQCETCARNGIDISAEIEIDASDAYAATQTVEEFICNTECNALHHFVISDYSEHDNDVLMAMHTMDPMDACIFAHTVDEHGAYVAMAALKCMPSAESIYEALRNVEMHEDFDDWLYFYASKIPLIGSSEDKALRQFYSNVWDDYVTDYSAQSYNLFADN